MGVELPESASRFNNQGAETSLYIGPRLEASKQDVGARNSWEDRDGGGLYLW